MLNKAYISALVKYLKQNKQLLTNNIANGAAIGGTLGAGLSILLPKNYDYSKIDNNYTLSKTLSGAAAGALTGGLGNILHNKLTFNLLNRLKQTPINITPEIFNKALVNRVSIPSTIINTGLGITSGATADVTVNKLTDKITNMLNKQSNFKVAPQTTGKDVDLSDVKRTKRRDSKHPPRATSEFLFNKSSYLDNLISNLTEKVFNSGPLTQVMSSQQKISANLRDVKGAPRVPVLEGPHPPITPTRAISKAGSDNTTLNNNITNNNKARKSDNITLNNNITSNNKARKSDNTTLNNNIAGNNILLKSSNVLNPDYVPGIPGVPDIFTEDNNINNANINGASPVTPEQQLINYIRESMAAKPLSGSISRSVPNNTNNNNVVSNLPTSIPGLIPEVKTPQQQAAYNAFNAYSAPLAKYISNNTNKGPSPMPLGGSVTAPKPQIGVPSQIAPLNASNSLLGGLPSAQDLNSDINYVKPKINYNLSSNSVPTLSPPPVAKSVPGQQIIKASPRATGIKALDLINSQENKAVSSPSSLPLSVAGNSKPVAPNNVAVPQSPPPGKILETIPGGEQRVSIGNNEHDYIIPKPQNNQVVAPPPQDNNVGRFYGVIQREKDRLGTRKQYLEQRLAKSYIHPSSRARMQKELDMITTQNTNPLIEQLKKDQLNTASDYLQAGHSPQAVSGWAGNGDLRNNKIVSTKKMWEDDAQNRYNMENKLPSVPSNHIAYRPPVNTGPKAPINSGINQTVVTRLPINTNFKQNPMTNNLNRPNNMTNSSPVGSNNNLPKPNNQFLGGTSKLSSDNNTNNTALVSNTSLNNANFVLKKAGVVENTKNIEKQANKFKVLLNLLKTPAAQQAGLMGAAGGLSYPMFNKITNKDNANTLRDAAVGAVAGVGGSLLGRGFGNQAAKLLGARYTKLLNMVRKANPDFVPSPGAYTSNVEVPAFLANGIGTATGAAAGGGLTGNLFDRFTKKQSSLIEKQAVIGAAMRAVAQAAKAAPAVVGRATSVMGQTAGNAAKAAPGFLGRAGNMLGKVWNSGAMQPIRGAAVGLGLGAGVDSIADLFGVDTGGMGSLIGGGMGGIARSATGRKILNSLGKHVGVRGLGKNVAKTFTTPDKWFDFSNPIAKAQTVLGTGGLAAGVTSALAQNRGQQAAIDTANQLAQNFGYSDINQLQASPVGQFLTGYNQNGLLSGLSSGFNAMSPTQKALVAAGVVVPSAMAVNSFLN